MGYIAIPGYVVGSARQRWDAGAFKKEGWLITSVKGNKMSNDQRIESFEARIRKLEEENATQKQKLLTHEIMTGLLLTNVIRVVDRISPNQNAAEILLKVLKEGESKILDGDACNDPHTKDAFTNAINAVSRALK